MFWSFTKPCHHDFSYPLHNNSVPRSTWVIKRYYHLGVELSTKTTREISGSTRKPFVLNTLMKCKKTINGISELFSTQKIPARNYGKTPSRLTHTLNLGTKSRATSGFNVSFWSDIPSDPEADNVVRQAISYALSRKPARFVPTQLFTALGTWLLR